MQGPWISRRNANALRALGQGFFVTTVLGGSLIIACCYLTN